MSQIIVANVNALIAKTNENRFLQEDAERNGFLWYNAHMGKHAENALLSKADISSEQQILSPEDDGIAGIPFISRSSYSTNWHALPPHTHEECIELCLCTRGSLVFECNGEAHTLLPDNVFLSQPSDVHHLVTNHKGMRMYWLFFHYPRRGKTVLGLSAAETAALVGELRRLKAHVFSVPRSMRQLFHDFFTCSGSLPKGLFRTLTLRTIALRILLLAIESSHNNPSVKVLAKISRIAAAIRRRPSHRFKVAELARHAGMSESHFTSLFRHILGLPPYAYLANCRLEEAKRLLAETDASSADIAKSLGYSSAPHLAAQFRKTYGMTAGEWRRCSRRRP